MSDIDRVVGALLTAVAALEDFTKHDSHEYLAMNALEGIAYELGHMDGNERQAFGAAISRIADARDAVEAGTGDWVRSVPHSLGVS